MRPPPAALCHTLWHMRTTLELRDDLMRSLLARHPGSSKREAVERAIEAYLARDAVEGVRALAGAFEVEDHSAELRRADRRA
jgi:hypothetical protein